MNKTIEIKILTGSLKDKIENFINLPINIGSDNSNELIIKEHNNAVSFHHAVILTYKERIALYNHSKLGTFINGKPINKVFLPELCKVQLGKEGPLLVIKIVESKEIITEEGVSSEIEKQRWYDRDTLISKAMRLLENSDDEKVNKVAQILIKILNKQNPEDLFYKSDVDIKTEINKLPRSCRWYDLNKSLQKVVEGLKLCKPEMKEKLALHIIMLLDSVEKEEKQIDFQPDQFTYTCPKCNQIIPPNAAYCSECGSNLDQKKEEETLITCLDCGAETNKNNNFCFDCGFNLKDAPKLPVIRKEDPPVVEQKPEEAIQTKTCPFCGEEIKLSAKKCLHCNEWLDASQHDLTECQYCYEKINKNTITCPHCNTTLKNDLQEAVYNNEIKVTVNSNMSTERIHYKKSKTVGTLLAFFLGGFGIHKFYTGKPIWGIIYLLFFWTLIPAIVALIETVMYICMSEEEFNRRYSR